ncbi:glycosyltransferase family 2 protein [Patescibacteria group bacterium]|nr:glycosyltransferase family 2 protein [Patescibacteria group bacterium]MBU2265034.1 glycosyltransferase family 2 protein [Patescibacteria group bacterium]
MFNPLISVNLLLYKPKFYLAPCLNSILAQSYDNFELLIIDNNSDDGTVERIKEIIEEAKKKSQKAVPPYKIIANKENRGFAAAHNQGINASRGELVALVNQDVVLDEDFIKRSGEVFNNEKIGSLQAKILRLKLEGANISKTDIIDTAGLIILKNRRIIARGQGQQDKGQFDKTEEIFGVDGALPIYRREALEDTKIVIDGKEEYLDEDFYMYKEDVDLAWRLSLFGWKSYYVPTIIAWHARTSGDSEARNYFAIVKERLKIGQFSKYLSFKNQRLTQIKNEQFGLLLRHLIYWLPKEIASWIYVILFEHYTWNAIKELFKQAPRARQKRKIIMARKKISGKEIEKWFK